MSDRSTGTTSEPDPTDGATSVGIGPDGGEPSRIGFGGNSPGGIGPGGVLPAGLASPGSAGVGVTLLAIVWVLASITDVVGGTGRLLAVVTVAIGVGIGLARLIAPRTAIRLTTVLAGVGLLGYYLAIPGSQVTLGSLPAIAFDVISLATGLSVLRLVLVDVWVLVFTPAPTFLAAYLAGRGRHVAGATVAGGTLGFFVLTGDAGTVVTLAGVIGVAIAVGTSTLSAAHGLRSHGRTLATVLAVMLLASATVTLVPTGAAQPWAVERGTPAIESTLVEDEELTLVGTTRLSPTVRFTVESPVERNWHTGSYDTYTGDGWVRSGETVPLNGSLAGPPGESTLVESSVTIETERETIPAPWQAVSVEGPLEQTAQVDERGTIRPGVSLRPGETVTVQSRVIDPSPASLREAGTDYPASIEERYTQLPESTPDRVETRTAAILEEAGAETPYDQAAALEAYFTTEYAYSLSVDRPTGDVADAFLFEMDAGYCTYFATTMAVMLRSQGVPARLATGYDSGQSVSDSEYVVRGQDAHAWVMVYVPEHGWVEFDPTPAAGRDRAERVRLAEARGDGVDGVDTARTEGGIVTTREEEPTERPAAGDTTASNATDATVSNGSIDPINGANETGSSAPGEQNPFAPAVGSGRVPADGTAGSGSGPSLPAPETVGYWVLAVVVAVVSARRIGVTDRAYHAVRLRTPGRSQSPRADAVRAFEDLERILERRYRARRPGETPRTYLAALQAAGVDERVHAVGETYERTAYAGTVSHSEAAAARRTVRRLALESTPILGRLWSHD